MKNRAASAFTLVTLLALGCRRLPEPELERLVRWMNCEECRSGERLAAARVGPRAVPTLARWLEQGPPDDRQQIMRRKFQSAYRASGGNPGTPAESVYVARLLENYVDRYQQRSALSLSDIQTEPAKRALDDALANAVARGYRPHVVATIRMARGRFGAVPFLGIVAPRVVSFGDSVHVFRPARAPLSGAELATLDGQSFPAADLILQRAPIQMTFAAVADPGPRQVSLQGFPGQTRVGSTGITINTRADASDRATRRCSDADYACLVMWAPLIGGPSVLPSPLPAAALPYTVFLSLSDSSPPRDTLDYFKIYPTTAKPVTARLAWHDSANLDLRWHACMPPMIRVPPNDGATPATRPERTSTTVPGGECRLLVVKMVQGAGASPTFARLTVTSP